MNILSTKGKSSSVSKCSEEVSVFFASVISSRSGSEIDSNGENVAFPAGVVKAIC